MTRFAWLQTRTQTMIAAALLAALAVAAVITGIQLAHLYDTLVTDCHTGCDFATQQFLSHDHPMDAALDILARAVPALLGIFWGAPLLARELETGTYRLAWTQSVSRQRWVVTKLAIGAAGTAAIAGVLTLTITWWNRSLDHLGADRYATFDRRDIVPIAYALFAFATGALVGAILRRSVPAMAATLGVFVLARVALAVWVRPHLLTPVHRTLALASASPSSPVQFGVGSRNGGALTLFVQGEGPKGSWTLSSHMVNASGHTPTSAQIAAFLHHDCPNVGLPPAAHSAGQGIARVVGPSAGRACLAKAAKAFHVVVTYQPADRYWTFQWLEAGIFLALALAAAVGCYWWITRRAY